MASKKKIEKPEEIVEKEQEIVETEQESVKEQVIEPAEEAKEVKTEEPKQEKPKKEAKKQEEKEIKPKFNIGDIVFISKEAEADLNGFKLFPPYKKYTYTVEAYEPKSDVYTLRRLNLSLRLKGELILAPSERAHDALNKKQY